jgi:hypothetical protein
MPQKKLSRDIRDAYVRARAQGFTQQESAQRAGCSRRAGVNFERDAATRREIDELREQFGPPDAIDFLRAVMNDPNAKTSDRIAAASKLISMRLIPDSAFESDADKVVGGEIHVHFDAEHLETPTKSPTQVHDDQPEAFTEDPDPAGALP